MLSCYLPSCVRQARRVGTRSEPAFGVSCVVLRAAVPTRVSPAFGACSSVWLVYLFVYLFLAALGLRCCAQAFSSCGERGLLFVVVCGLLIEVASLVEHRL